MQASAHEVSRLSTPFLIEIILRSSQLDRRNIGNYISNCYSHQCHIFLRCSSYILMFFIDSDDAPLLTERSSEVRPISRSSSEVPSISRSLSEVPPISRSSSEVPPISRSSSEVPPISRSLSEVPPISRSSSDITDFIHTSDMNNSRSDHVSKQSVNSNSPTEVTNSNSSDKFLPTILIDSNDHRICKQASFVSNSVKTPRIWSLAEVATSFSYSGSRKSQILPEVTSH